VVFRCVFQYRLLTFSKRAQAEEQLVVAVVVAVVDAD